ncbi:FMN-linked oxidoreductase [Boletus coccyginus]|nr:FMN-linked oxidoreductase [Boletus coccyginus]
MVPDLTYISAPMVNQSDAPFRLLTRRYGATLTYTQMLDSHRLLNDPGYLHFHLRDLQSTHPDWDAYTRPVVVQLCGNDPEVTVSAARRVQAYCDGIDLNLGCPQEHAREGHFGGYLLTKKDWPLVDSIVSAMARSLTVPSSVKTRLCPSAKTTEFARLLEHAGASWVTLHARHVSAKRRRQGAADLDAIRELKQALTIPVISNGNVRTFSDVEQNASYTGADGVMVGETLLGNPCLFSGETVRDPVLMALDYLDACKRLADVATLQTMRAHVRYIIEFQCARRPWYSKFRLALNACQSVDDIEVLLRRQVSRWRGKVGRLVHGAPRGHGGEEETRGDADPEDLGDILDCLDVSDGSFH